MRRFLRVFFTLLVLLLLAVAGAWWAYRRTLTPYRGFQGDEVFVDVPSGTREIDIARELADAGVVPDPWTFRLAARFSHADRHLQAGEYRFTGPSTPQEVVARMARGDVFTRGVTFPEGLTIREMAAIFEQSGLGAAGDFQQAAANGALAAPIDPGASSLEGYLFPSTYAMSRKAGGSDMVQAMLTQFERVFDATRRADAAAQHLTPREVVTLASLVEKETAQPDERSIVSAVYLNRLRVRMPLQCDPTVIYALMQAGTWNGNLTRDNLQIDSPYNTYRYPGLPPGPIASPGRSSIDAALHPADVPYLYFVSRNDGTHVFASTLREHNQNVDRWQRQGGRQK